MVDAEDGFGDDAEIDYEQEIVDGHDGARQRILHGCQERVSGAFGDGGEGGLKRRSGHGGNGAAEKLDGGCFAESAGFALKSHAHGLAIGRAHSRRYLAIRGAKRKAKFRSGEEKTCRNAWSAARPHSRTK